MVRWHEGQRVYLYGVDPWLWSPRRRLAYRFFTPREADRLTRGVGWRCILEVDE